MKKQDKHKAPAEPPSKGMSLDAIMEQLSDLKDIATSLQTPMDGDRVAACEAATDILNALQDEGIKDPEQVRDLIHDYNALAEQYRKMHQRYEEPAQVLRLGGGARAACLCPECHNQSRPGNPYCWNCGKRLGWRR